MEEQIKEKPNFLKVLFYAVFFGALWGIIEATLGTVLHLPAFEVLGTFGKSSAVMLPIAYFLMALCYKKSESKYAVFMMGVVAGLIKLTVAFVIGFIDRVYCPAIYIVLEASIMGAALILFNPKDVLSLKTFGAIILANTVYQFSYLCLSIAFGSKNAFSSPEMWESVGVKYLLTLNCVAILYAFAFGGIAYLVMQLLKKHNVSFKFDINKLISSPITAAVTFALAVGITVSFAALF